MVSELYGKEDIFSCLLVIYFRCAGSSRVLIVDGESILPL